MIHRTEGASPTKSGAWRAHFVLQSKGGVGKTLVALLLARCLAEKRKPVVCIDSNPGCATLSRLLMRSCIEVEWVNISSARQVDTCALDLFSRRRRTEDACFVIDTGPGPLDPIVNDAVQLLIEDGRSAVVHSVITGGSDMIATVGYLNWLLQHYPPTVRIVVWINEVFGPVVNASGKGFEELPIYRDNRDRIFAIVRLPKIGKAAIGCFYKIVTREMPVFEALMRETEPLFRTERSRLYNHWEAVRVQVERVI